MSINIYEKYWPTFRWIWYRCEQKRRGSDESFGSFESRWLRTSQAAKAGNKEIRKRISQAETYRETDHTSASQVSDALCSYALRRRTSCESLDHRGCRQLRLVDRHLRRVRTGESKEIFLIAMRFSIRKIADDVIIRARNQAKILRAQENVQLILDCSWKLFLCRSLRDNFVWEISL